MPYRHLIHKHHLATVSLVFLSIAWYMSGTSDERNIILPCIVIINTSAYCLIDIWIKDNCLPFFDAGAMLIIACLLYTVMPAIGYLQSGMEFNALSSAELYVLSPTTTQLTPLIWRYVLFAVIFMVVYIWFRPVGVRQLIVSSSPPFRTLFTFIIIISLLELGFIIIKLLTGIDMRATYDSIDQTFESFSTLPIFLQQVVNNLLGIITVLKMFLLVLVVKFWKKGSEQWALVLCVSILIASYLLKVGSRTETIVLILTCGLSYHRFVKPLKASMALFAGVFLLISFMLFGLMRGGSDLKTNVAQLSYMTSQDVPLLSIAIEFQVLFGCTYELKALKESGELGQIPYQLKLYDILLLIPNQLLPIEKINPTYYYWDYSSTKGFFSFNPIAQSIIGFDWIELVIRGGLLGWIFAKIYGWYISRSSSFWVTFSYLFIVVWSYYAIKSSTFIWLYFILYRLIPALLLIYFLTKIPWGLRLSANNGKLEL